MTCDECGEKVSQTRRITSDFYQIDVCLDCIADAEDARIALLQENYANRCED